MAEEQDTKKKMVVVAVLVGCVIVGGRLISPWLGGGIAGDACGGALGGAVGWGICKQFRLL